MFENGILGLKVLSIYVLDAVINTTANAKWMVVWKYLLYCKSRTHCNCQFTFQCLIPFCTHTHFRKVTTAFYNWTNSFNNRFFYAVLFDINMLLLSISADTKHARHQNFTVVTTCESRYVRMTLLKLYSVKVAHLFCLLGAFLLFKSAIYCQRTEVHFHSASSARLLIHVGVVNIRHVYTPLVSVNILTLNSSSKPTRSSGALVLWSFCRCPSREDTSSSVSPYRKYSSRAW